ncbi:MAG: NAD(P)-dependent oxidoreductase [Burkholderiales bacterium]|nr:MAG: NAD(P)-dependent oxidoreductase [Burkholderiales bacterium]
MERTVSIIGAGNMGGGIALNLLARGYAVHVCDIDAAKERFLEQKGALAVIKPAQAAIKSGATIICVVGSAQVQDVLLGADGLLKASPQDLQNHTVILCPTISPQDVERFAALLGSHGVALIEAPMSGGPKRAQDGSMSLMVACENTLFKQHEPLLRDLSSKLFHVSQRLGDGARTKLVNNLLAAINLTGAAEAMAMAQKLGLDASRTLDVIEQSSGQSWIGSERMRRALAGDVHPPGAHMTLLAKDSKLAMQAARDVGCSNAVGEVATGLFAQALEAGMADDDDAQMLKFLRR